MTRGTRVPEGQKRLFECVVGDQPGMTLVKSWNGVVTRGGQEVGWYEVVGQTQTDPRTFSREPLVRWLDPTEKENLEALGYRFRLVKKK